MRKHLNTVSLAIKILVGKDNIKEARNNMDLEIFDWHQNNLLADKVLKALERLPAELIIGVTKNDDKLADTDKWSEVYDIPLGQAANVIIVETRKTRNSEPNFAAVLVHGDKRADLNGIVKKIMGISKISFAKFEQATELTEMESGGMSPIGLPSDWTLVVDEAIIQTDKLYLGSGLRKSKLVVNGSIFKYLQNNVIIEKIIKS
jgi:prolyl-tRNA editing enzyme YbaK/EbsC (Cys-tRNA(Pro) deacylase)